MAKIVNFFRAIRNNWKMSAVGAAAFSYGISYSKKVYDTNQLMREYCESVVKYGDAPLPTDVKPRHMTVILNPAAKKRKAQKLFKQYCEPLLHLAGIAVTVISIESGNQARNTVMNLETPTDAIIVAGGDGTVSDVLTGLMRKYQSNISYVKQCPIGILPLGEKKKIASSLYERSSDLRDVRELIDATMAIINQNSKLVDAIQIQTIEENPEEETKTVYAMGGIEWGAWKDAQAAASKYWYWGSLKKYMTYIFSGYKQNLNWDCNAVLRYTDPCTGCSSCYQKDSTNELTEKRWWHVFIPTQRTLGAIDYSKVTNQNCGIFHEIPVSTSELHIDTSNINKPEDPSVPSLKVELAPKDVNYFSFINKGWKQEKGKESLTNQLLQAKDVELIPHNLEDTNPRQFFIDNEEYELKPVKVKLLTKSVKIFCPKSDS